ncbi:MAG: YigZ family protein [Bacteroidaceae bacterium]|nr:YigZ family protein [Bacteroidaceae bacterium]
MVDSYWTIGRRAEIQFTEKRSRFISFAIPVRNVDEVRTAVGSFQKEYYDARHICYAYMLGPERKEWRANDNGEPSGTAGKPILGQINSSNLSDILIVVVRYFGGVKLGTSGLTEAYRRAAAEVISVTETVERFVEREVVCYFTYGHMNDVMRVVKDLEPRVISQDYGSFASDTYPDRFFDCRLTLCARLSVADTVVLRLKKLTETQRVPEIVILGDGIEQFCCLSE